MTARTLATGACVLTCTTAEPAAAQQPPAPVDVVAPDAFIRTPPVVGAGGRLKVQVRGLPRPVRVQQRVGDRWILRADPILEVGQSVTVRAPLRARRMRLRARGDDGGVTASRLVSVRTLRLAAVGDVNLGDAPGAAIAAFGARWPWSSVGGRLRAADLAFANLECAVSLRGTPQDKQFVFRGRPSALRAAQEAGGLDMVSLANNHAGDYGRVALLDTLRHTRDAGLVPVGAGATEQAAYRPRVVEKLGLRVAFVAFSEILPFEFRAVGARPGTAWAFPGRITTAVRAARRRADVVVASFHWGIERARTESARQRQLAALALQAGAHAVIGAHPHVLQPIRRPSRRLVAYSLGNFVFGAHSAGTASTGILEIELAAGRVVTDRFVPATIVGTRPVLRHRGGGGGQRPAQRAIASAYSRARSR